MTRTTLWMCALLSVVAIVAGGSPAAVAETRAPHANVMISADGDFTRANGVRSGDGSKAHPYDISGWRIANLTIQNTDKWVSIHNNSITSRLVLDWIGDKLNMQHNVVNDMRLNQNVARTGMMTSGLISHNQFVTVGQLRHWDGVFADNVVGTKNNLGAQAVNFDGFNGAHFVHNTIYGYVDARLHGHHHSSGWGKPSHDHTMDAANEDPAMHRYRYHEVTISDNAIYSTNSYALAYLDTGHSGNDRTAPSETDQNLNLPHIHYTKVHIVGNRLYGAGILVNTFNASDNLHPWFARGYVDIQNNRITLDQDPFWTFKQLNGIEVDQAQAVTLHITGNSISGWRPGADDPLAFLEGFDSNAGILLNTLDDADISIMHTRVTNRVYGVHAMQMTAKVHWMIRDLQTSGVDHPVSYDSNVANKPG